MEYDADKFMARVAGSEVFEASSRRIVELSVAEAITHNMLAENFESAGLPDNLPLCLSKVARKLPPAVKKIVNGIIQEEETGWFASHPAQRDRIAAAHREEAEGIFHLERPARVLLKSYEKVSQSATLLLYQRLIGRRAAKQQLKPTETFLTQVGFDETSI